MKLILTTADVYELVRKHVTTPYGYEIDKLVMREGAATDLTGEMFTLFLKDKDRKTIP